MPRQLSGIELKVMEHFEVKDAILFDSNYLDALKAFNHKHVGISHSADYAIFWLVNYLAKLGYKRKQ